MILKMILKSFEFQCDFDFDFQITSSKMIWILILNHLYLGDLILILKSSTYDDFAHLCIYIYINSLGSISCARKTYELSRQRHFRVIKESVPKALKLRAMSLLTSGGLKHNAKKYILKCNVSSHIV